MNIARRLSSRSKVLCSLAFAAFPALFAAAQSYVPPITTTAPTTLYTNTTAFTPGRVAIDKAGNTFYLGHGSSTATLFELPASSPAKATTPVTLITGLGQYNAQGVFVDPTGNLWIANGNGSATVSGTSESIGLVELPASGGIPNTGALVSGGSTLAQVAAVNCTAAPTAPCVYQDNTFATNLTNYYSQPSDLFVTATTVYFVDVYDGISSGKYNRVLSFSIASPGTGTLVADNLPSSTASQVAVDGAGKVYYADATTNTVSSITAGTLTTVGTSATIASAQVTKPFGVSADIYGNLYISSATQLSEVPFEGLALNFADEFGILNPLTTSAAYGGTLDQNGNYVYATTSSVILLQINGYNFGSVPVGTYVTAASSVPAPTITLYTNAANTGISSYFPTGSPTTNTVVSDLQSFPYSNTKSYGGGAAFAAGATGTIVMNFDPIHPGLLKGSYTPRNGGANLSVVNLQGTGVGPQPLFLPGTPSQLFSASSKGALSSPLGLAVDTYGDVFVADSANGKLVADCIATTTANSDGTGGSTANGFCAGSPYTGAITQLGTGFTTPAAVALDGGNNLYVADSSASSVTRIDGVSLTATTPITATTLFGTSILSGPKGIAVDGYTNIFIADTGNNRIVKAHQFGATNTDNVVYVPAATTFAGTPLSSPTGLAVDAAGNLFIADKGNNRVVEFSALGVPTVVSTGTLTLTAPTAVAVYPSGAVVVSDTKNGISLLNGASSTVLSFGSTFTTTTAQGVALDLLGNLYVSNTGTNQVLTLNVNTAATVAYPTTMEGTTSAAVTTPLFNIGNAPLALSALALTSTSTNFTIASNGTCTATSTVAAASFCNIVTQFTPQTTALPGTLTGTLNVSSNTPTYTIVNTTTNETGNFTATSTQGLNLIGIATPAITGTTPQTITFPQPTSPVSATVGTITLAATASSGLPVSFTVTSGPGTVSGSTLTVTGSGSIIVAAAQNGNGTYAAALVVSDTIVVNPAAQTITFPQPTSPVTFGIAPITLAATSSSGLAVTFTVASGPGTIVGSVLTVTGGGSIVINADQAGNTTYAAAPTVMRTIVISPTTQTITFTQPTSPVTYNTTAIPLVATSSSGLAVTFTATGPATVSGTNLTLTGAGTVIVTAAQAGNASYTAAPAVSYSILVNFAGVTATPVFGLAAGTYPVNQVVTLTSSTPGAVIYYTVDGSTPTSASLPAYTAAGIMVPATETVTAIAIAPGYSASATAAVTYTIAPATFALVVAPTSITVKDGSSGSAAITVTPSYNFGGAVSFACTGLPAGASCSFSPAPLITAGNGVALASTVTVSTTAATAALQIPPATRTGFLLPGTSMAALAFCFCAFRKRRRLHLLLLLVVGFAALDTLTGCADSTNTSAVSTPTGTSTVTLTATGGTVIQKTTFSLIVQ